MKIERKQTVAGNPNIIRVTTTDERWYEKHEGGIVTYVPSVTWITNHYPKGKGYDEWQRKHGDDAEQLMLTAGARGSKVHAACNDLLLGKMVAHDAVYYNDVTGREEELTPYEYECVISFYDWYENDRTCPRKRCGKKRGLVVVDHDYIVWGDGYAGTGDLKLERACCDGARGPFDIKTSKAVYESHRAQVQAYRKGDPETRGRKGFAGILQLGYAANKVKKYKVTYVPNTDWRLFVTARRVWEERSANIVPHQRDYPIALVLRDRVNLLQGAA